MVMTPFFLKTCAVLHHELHVAERVDVRQRIAFNADDVREVTRP